MKEHFTIGEISTLLGLSSHTLRYYDKIGLLRPTTINEKTGYRYYAYHQLFTLERIRHLQLLGFDLDEIRDIISDFSTNTLLQSLDRRKRELDTELERLSVLRNTVSNYLDYYHHADDGILPGVPFKAHYGPRYLFAEPYRPGESVCYTAGYRLMVRKSEPDCARLDFLREIGLLLDYPSLLDGRVIPTHYYMFLEKQPETFFPEVQLVPEGDFLCYRCPVLDAEADISIFSRLLADCRHQNRLVLANEWEQNLDDSVGAFETSVFEIQIAL